MTMTSKEALENIKNWVEYITRLDYVEPIVRGEVKQLLYDAYHKTTPEFEQIEKDLKVLEILKKMDWVVITCVVLVIKIKGMIKMFTPLIFFSKNG